MRYIMEKKMFSDKRAKTFTLTRFSYAIIIKNLWTNFKTQK